MWVFVMPFTLHVFKVRPHCNVYQYFYVAKVYSIVWMDYIFSIHQLLDIGLFQMRLKPSGVISFSPQTPSLFPQTP